MTHFVLRPLVVLSYTAFWQHVLSRGHHEAVLESVKLEQNIYGRTYERAYKKSRLPH